MKEKIITIFKETIIEEYRKSLIGKYCFACSINFFDRKRNHQSLWSNCRGRRNISACREWSTESKMLSNIQQWEAEELIEYINDLIKGRVENQKLSETVENLIVNQFKNKLNYKFDKRKKNPLYKSSTPFIKKEIGFNIDEICSEDIPYLSSKEIKNADFFSSLYYLFYHLEVSIRNYLRRRYKSLFKEDWERKILDSGLVSKAFHLKKSMEVSDCYTKRGDDILNYCNWIDYVELIKLDERIWDKNPLDKNEFLAHISSIYKVRNAIAHCAETIPKNIIEEMGIFVKKYVRIFK